MDEVSTTSPGWVSLSLEDVAQRLPAHLQAIRCALPATLTRRQLDDGNAAAPTAARCGANPARLWGRKLDSSEEWLVLWNEGQPVWQWGSVHISRDEELRFGPLPSHDDDWLRDAATAMGTALGDMAVHRVPWNASSRETSTQAVPSQQDDIDIDVRVNEWHADLIAKMRAGGVYMRRSSGAPLHRFEDWRLPDRRRRLESDDPMRKALALAIARQILNFRLLDNADLQIVWATQLPSYPSTQLIEIVDRRALRARHTELLLDSYPESPTVFPLDGGVDPLHELTQRHAKQWERQFDMPEGSARYLDFFVRSIYAPGDDNFFELILDPERDLRVNHHLPSDQRTAKLFEALRKRPDAIGLWTLEPDAADKSTGGDNAGPTAEPQSAATHTRVFSALMLYGRNLYLVALKVWLEDGRPLVEMIDDVICRGGENLHVQPLTIDPDGEFVLARRDPVDDREAEPETQPAPVETPAPIDVASTPASKPALDLPTVRGCIDGSRFSNLFGDERFGSLPRGEDATPRAVARKPVLEIADFVSLRGRRDLHGSRLVIGVHFRGRVDLREILIGGSLTLAYCTFDEPLLLDDAEIDGSLSVKGSELRGGLSLRNAIVRGRVDLSSAFFVTGDDPRKSSALVLSGATIDGDLDLRGTGETGVRHDPDPPSSLQLDGCRIQGSLRLGNGPGGHREPMVIRRIDAQAMHVHGSVSVWGSCSVEIVPEQRRHWPLTIVSLSGTEIDGDVEIRAHDRGVRTRPFDHENLDDAALDEDRSLPRLGQFVLNGARIKGSVLAHGCEVSNLSMTGAKIEGRVLLRASFVRQESNRRPRPVAHWPVALDDLDMRGLIVGATLTLEGVELRGSLSLVEARIDGMIYIGPASIDQDAPDVLELPKGGRRPALELRTRIGRQVEMAVLRCPSHVRFEGVVVGQWLSLINAETGPFVIDPALLRQGPPGLPEGLRWEVVPSQLGGIAIFASEIKGWLYLRLVQVLGHPMQRWQRGIRLDTTVVHGDFMLWQAAFARDLARRTSLVEMPDALVQFIESLPTWQYSAAVIGDLTLRRCELRADCSLSLTKVSGRIDLRDSHVFGDVMLASLRTHTEASEGNLGILQQLRASHDPSDWVQRTSCAGLTLGALVCDSDVFLDGARIDVLSMVDAPAVDAHHLRVQGDFVCADHDGGDGSGSSLLVENGDLNLGDADLNRCVLADTCLPRCSGKVQLARAKIRTFVFTWRGGVAAPYPQEGSEVIFDLDGTEIGEWKLCDGRRADGVERIETDNSAALFERLIDRTGKTPVSVWTSMERYLRNRGSDGDANILYRQMKRGQARRREAVSTDDIWHPILTGVLLAALMLSGLAAAVYASSSGPIVWTLLVLLAALLWWLPWTRDRLARHAIGYGTTVAPVICAWFVLLLVSLPVYLAPANFELSNAARASRKIDPAIRESLSSKDARALFEPRAAAETWSVGHAIGVAVRYHVPIIGVAPLDDWEPADTRQGRDFQLSYCPLPELASLPTIRCSSAWTIPGLSAQAYTAFMQTLSWIAWPVFLTFMALNLWRGRPGGGS